MKLKEYICTHCGRRVIRPEVKGRPVPGNCPRKPRTKDGKMRPHSWVVNRTVGG